MPSEFADTNGPYLFVYGTLRPGHSGKGSRMMRKLMADAVHIGRGRARGKLFRVGWYPGLVSSTKPNEYVVGDVFRLPRESGLLTKLDRYEDASTKQDPNREYIRRRKVVTLDSGDQVVAWAYVYNRPVSRTRLIEDGDFVRTSKRLAKVTKRSARKSAMA